MINSPHSTIAPTAWDPEFCARSPMFGPLAGWAARLRGPHWPTLDKLQSLASEEPVLRVHNGAPLAVVRQEKTWSLGYEARAYLHGEVQVRAADWHDLMNVLVWRTFPKTKAALNRAHYAALPEAAAGRRGARRDVLTLFDESGVIVLASDDALLDALRGFRWHELFWLQRERVRRAMRFIVFGHALYEKALAPYIGLTGHALLFRVGGDVLQQQLMEQAVAADDLAAAHIAADTAALTPATALSPLPVLGVPGWWPDNEQELFYSNARYFRPGRRQGNA